MFQNIPPITKRIIILNVIVYLISNLWQFPLLYNYLSVFYPTSPHFYFWQIITHMFMHAPFVMGGGIMHIIFNMFTLLSFGPVLEARFGARRYALLYFLSGIGAYLLNIGWNFFQITFQGADSAIIEGTPMIGASGAIFGVVAAFATLYPNAKLIFLFIPFPIKAKILMIIVIAGSVVLGYTGTAGGIAHFAHVGGAIVGFLLAKYWKKHLERFNHF